MTRDTNRQSLLSVRS